MMNTLDFREKILLSSTFLTIVLFNPLSFEPYNALKLYILVTAGTILFLHFFLFCDFRAIILENKTVSVIVGLFLSLLIFSSLLNSNNIMQTLIGAYGRNNGLLSWLALMFLFLSTAYNLNHNLSTIFLKLFVSVGIPLGIYAWTQYTQFDLIRILFPWFNESRRIDATFGNSNLFAVYVSMVLISSIGVILSQEVNKKFRTISFLGLLIYLPLLPRIDFQGKVLSSLGMILLFSLWAISKQAKVFRLTGSCGLATIIIGSVLFLAALFEKGPLVNYLSDYLPSFRDRVFFWQAAIRIIQDFTFFGVGLDEMNYWYRRYRLADSVGYRGPVGEGADNVHNLFLQLGATTGIFVLTIFIVLVGYILYKGVNVVKNKHNSVSIITLFVLWTIFILQSIISFDNLSIMVIGFVVSGILLSSSKSNYKINSPEKNSNKSKDFLFFNGLKYIRIFIVGISIIQIAFLNTYLINDLAMHQKWRVIKSSIDLNQKPTNSQLEDFIKEVLKSQQSLKRMRASEQVLLYGQVNASLKIADQTSKDFPEEIQSWNTIARIFEAFGQYESAVFARQKLVELDPLNPEFKSKLSQNIQKWER